jgi:hypothetical protein
LEFLVIDTEKSRSELRAVVAALSHLLRNKFRNRKGKLSSQMKHDFVQGDLPIAGSSGSKLLGKGCVDEREGLLDGAFARAGASI